MQILEFDCAAVTHNKLLHQSASEVASWKIHGKRIMLHTITFIYCYTSLVLVG